MLKLRIGEPMGGLCFVVVRLIDCSGLHAQYWGHQRRNTGRYPLWQKIASIWWYVLCCCGSYRVKCRITQCFSFAVLGTLKTQFGFRLPNDALHVCVCVCALVCVYVCVCVLDWTLAGLWSALRLNVDNSSIYVSKYI